MIVKNKTMMDAGCILFTRKLEDAGQGRYAISLYATPNRRTNKIIARLKELYNEKISSSFD